MTQPQSSQDELVMQFFKALADVQRLKIIGLLAVRPHSLPALSETLHTQPGQVTRHLDRLVDMHLVKTDAEFYSLDEKALEGWARQVLSGRRVRLTPQDFEGEAFDRKVLSDFTLPDGRFKSLPAQQKKLLVLLGHAVQAFELGVQYPEKQVNQVLVRYYEDTASLRRALIDFGFMERQQGIYWRSAKNPSE
jgi:hypothetical protein